MGSAPIASSPTGLYCVMEDLWRGMLIFVENAVSKRRTNPRDRFIDQTLRLAHVSSLQGSRSHNDSMIRRRAQIEATMRSALHALMSLFAGRLVTGIHTCVTLASERVEDCGLYKLMTSDTRQDLVTLRIWMISYVNLMPATLTRPLDGLSMRNMGHHHGVLCVSS